MAIHNQLTIEVAQQQRPGALAWHRRAVEAALDQARRYADEQKVGCIGVSDGCSMPLISNTGA
jgi:hypothetical protein